MRERDDDAALTGVDIDHAEILACASLEHIRAQRVAPSTAKAAEIVFERAVGSAALSLQRMCDISSKHRRLRSCRF
jgi:hypothetical protein